MRLLLLLLVLAANAAFAGADMTPEHRKAVEAVMAAQEMERTGPPLLQQAARGTGESLRRAASALVERRTDISPEQKERSVRAIDALTRDLAGDLAREYAQLDLRAVSDEIGFRVYAPRFTTEELQQLAAFYASPAGKKMLGIEIGAHGPGDAPTPEEKQEIARFTQTPAARHVLQPEVQRQIDEVLENHMARIRNRVVEKYRAPIRQAIASPPG